MFERLKDVWLPGALFIATLATALALAATVLVAPWITSEHPLVALFAHDLTVRRTSLFSALGLVVTAFVFFRPKPAPPPTASKPETQNAAGA